MARASGQILRQILDTIGALERLSPYTLLNTRDECLLLRKLPTELILQIVDCLYPTAIACLALTCTTLYRILFRRMIDTIRGCKLCREPLLLLIEKDIKGWYYCHACVKLHRFSIPWSLGTDRNPERDNDRQMTRQFTTIPGAAGRRDRLKKDYSRRSHQLDDTCVNITGSWRSLCLHIARDSEPTRCVKRLPRLELKYHHARLAMSNHQYGSGHGLPLDLFNLNFDSTIDECKSEHCWEENWTARVIKEELFIQGKHALRLISERHDLANSVKQSEYRICWHSRLGYEVPLPRRAPRKGQISEFTTGQCDTCLTDWEVESEWVIACGWLVTVTAHHQLGTCESPEDWKWKAMADPARPHGSLGPSSNWHLVRKCRGERESCGGLAMVRDAWDRESMRINATELGSEIVCSTR